MKRRYYRGTHGVTGLYLIGVDWHSNGGLGHSWANRVLLWGEVCVLVLLCTGLLEGGLNFGFCRGISVKSLDWTVC